MESRKILIRRRSFLASSLCVGLIPNAFAIQYPSRPIALIAASSPGGELDNFARRAARALGLRLNQTIVVEDIGGASGALAARRVLHAPPDGYTLLFGSTSDMVVAPIGNAQLNYTALDFSPIAKFGETALALVARPGLGVTTADEFARLARAQTVPLSIGAFGERSLQALAASALAHSGGLRLVNIPYRDGHAMLNDLAVGTIDAAITALPAATRYMHIGKISVLGILSKGRSKAAPEIPTVNEGIECKDLDIEIWAGFAGPAGMPIDIVTALNLAVNGVLRDPSFRNEGASPGESLAAPQGADAFGRFLRAEDAKFRDLTTFLRGASQSEEGH